MEYNFVSFGHDDDAKLDLESMREVKATSEAELRLKIRGRLLAQIDDIVSDIVRMNFEERFVTKAGQRLLKDELDILNSLPPGHGVVTRAGWRATHGCWEDWAEYHVPAGSILPNGRKLKEGEWIQLRYNMYFPGGEERQIDTFFKDKRNVGRWITIYDENGCYVEEVE